MSVTVTPLVDGGRVEATWAGGNSPVHLQKYDASGTKVGSEYVDSYSSNQQPQVVALSNGGFAVMVGFVFKGADYPIRVFDAVGQLVGTAEAAGGGIGATIAASPTGGFMVVSMDSHYDGSGSSAGVDYSWRPFLTLYDNSGAAVRGPAPLSGDKPTVTVLSDGHYQLNWSDGNLSHSLNIDPASPPSLAKPAAPGVTMIDNQGPNTGPIAPGAYTTDGTPVVRVAVHEIGSVEVSRVFQNGVEQTIEGGVQVTAADVARGYVDVELDWSAYGGVPPTALSGTSWTFYAHVRDANGVISDATAVSQPIVFQPEIWAVTDDAGATTGRLSDGQTTDDATPTLRVGLESSSARAGSDVVVRDGQTEVGRATLTAQDAANGYVDVTTTTLANGEHALTVANGGPYNPAFRLTVAAPVQDTQPRFLNEFHNTGGIGVSVWEGVLPGGTSPNPSAATASQVLYLSAPDGVKDLVVDGHAVISGGAFTAVSFATYGVGTLSFNSYDPTTGKLGYSFNLTSAIDNRPIPGQTAPGLPVAMTLTDADGDQAQQNLVLSIDDDGVRAVADTASATAGGPAVTGNLRANDTGADGVVLATVNGQPVGSGLHLTGTRGDLVVQSNGSFTYTPFANASAGTDGFGYGVRDYDSGSTSQSTLTINVVGQSASSGRVYTSPGPNSTVAGGSGDDTLVASGGGDTLTGGAGADVFQFKSDPWSPVHITDFAVGTDKLDFSAVFTAAGYTGSDPVADKVIFLQSDGNGGTQVLFDRDGSASGQQWPNYSIDLQGVSPTGLTWAKLTGGAAPAPSYGTVNISPASVSHVEGNSGLTSYSFTLTRSGDVSSGATTAYRVTGSGDHPIDASDLENGYLPNVVFAWNAGETSKVITVNVAGDTTAETDETFSVTLVPNSNGSGSHPTAVGPNATATGVILNDDGSTTSQPGQVYNSPGPGSTVTGGAGDDTINASQGADVLTGNGGADTFAYAHLPWTHGRITDFHLGQDRLDLSGLLRDAGYTGSDPVADGYVRLTNDLSGTNTLVYFDADGNGTAHQWDGFFTTLEGVYGAGGTKGGVSTLTWAQVSGGSGGSSQPPPPPPPSSQDGQVVTSHQYGDTLTGTAGNDTLQAGQGPDRLTGAGGADLFAFQNPPWNAGHVTDFAPGVDKLDLRGLFGAYHGSNPLADGWLEFRPDGAGGTQVYVDHDGPNVGDWPFLITTLDGVAPGQIGASDWIFN